MKNEDLILVNENDEPIGNMEKLQVHQQGLLHRAFSVFVFDKSGRMLLQKRALNKYHGGGLWTNTCCSHPKTDEPIQLAAEKRLLEEMGFTTPLKKAFEFVYYANVENDLIEHEYDHVFTGIYEGDIKPDKKEVSDFCYKHMEDISKEIAANPSGFTAWFRIAFPKIKSLLPCINDNKKG